MSDDLFAPPPFDADRALIGLKRQLRELRLTERAGGFEWKGQLMVELALDRSAIRIRTVKQPARSPEWVSWTLTSSADVRRFTEDFARRFAQWTDRDDW